jgi:hypothetical protein
LQMPFVAAEVLYGRAHSQKLRHGPPMHTDALHYVFARLVLRSSSCSRILQLSSVGTWLRHKP